MQYVSHMFKSCCSPVRDDVDKKGDKCAVYDVVFHSDTYKMSSNPAFLKMIHDTALDGKVFERFSVSLSVRYSSSFANALKPGW